MIRRSNPADLPALQALWQAVFGDPPAFTGRFYETFGADSALVAEEDGRVVAMIHPLPVALAQNRLYSFGVYIYALATAPDYRGRGIASSLLQAAENAPFATVPTLGGNEWIGPASLAAQIPAFSLLIPGEESLFSYYHARGYQREANVVSVEAETYAEQLLRGAESLPIFLKPEPFYTFSRRIPEPVPPPMERALWKPLVPDLPESEPTLSHFMQ